MTNVNLIASIKLSVFAVCCLLLLNINHAEAADEGQADLATANQQFANPLATATLFITENNFVGFDGTASDGHKETNFLIFDPLFPMQLGDSDWSVVHRPILPIVTGADIPQPDGSFESQNGVGDITYFAAFTPKPKSSFVWGAGPIFRFPTASDDDIGAEKWSVGPMAVALISTKKYSVGALNQNLFSFAGDDDRESVALSTLQYFFFYNFTPQWGFGTAPIISYNWNADKSSDEWSVPIGAGITHTFQIGKTPARVLLEGQYYAVDQETFGPRWNFRLALALFLPKLGK